MIRRRLAPLTLAVLTTVGAGGLAACQPVPELPVGSAATATTTTPGAGAPTQLDGATRAERGLVAVAVARTQLGQPYRTGGESRAEGGFDCSGLTFSSWKAAGVTLPRSSTAQYAGTTRIDEDDLEPGDLVFYSSAGRRGKISHVALYAGDRTIIQARRPGIKLGEADLDTYWTKNLVGYGRVVLSGDDADEAAPEA